MTNGGWFKNPIFDLFVGIFVAGIVGWATAFFTVRDYIIKDEQRHSEITRRLDALEQTNTEVARYLRQIDQRLSRIEGKLGIIP